MNHGIGDLTAQAPRTFGKALLYGRRALALLCPTCGKTQLFHPWKNVKSLSSWFTPNDGCPFCGYAFEREPGYFLLAIWGVNYGVVALGGMALYFVLRYWTEWSPQLIFCLTVLPAPLLSILLARHAKSFFLAMDHFCDPHVRHKMKRENIE